MHVTCFNLVANSYLNVMLSIKSIHLARESSVNQTYKFHGDIVIALSMVSSLFQSFLLQFVLEILHIVALEHV